MAMIKRIGSDEVVTLLRSRLQGGLTQCALAAELGISPQYLHDVLARNRAPGGKLLGAMGLKREIVYAPEDQP